MPDYHDQTAYEREAMMGHLLDWAHQPDPFKRYKHRDVLSLPQPRVRRAGFWDLVLSDPPPAQPRADSLDAADVAAMLLMGAGITARTAAGMGDMGLRAPASAGALYPAELYAVACGVNGLEDGLYHFFPEQPGLHLLWPGMLAKPAAKRLGAEPGGLTFFISAMYWRSLWKYRQRAYRYCLLDAGHMLANLELAVAANGLAPRVTADFNDASVGVFLGLASDDEAALAGISAGPPLSDPGPDEESLPPFDLQAKALSARIGRDAEVLAAHAAGNLDEPLPPRTWPVLRPPAGSMQLSEPSPAQADLLETIRSRRSRRNFLPAAVKEAQVSALLKAALPAPGPCQATVLLGPGGDLDGGVYRYSPGLNVLTPIPTPPDDARRAMAKAALGQLWVGQAAMVLVLWADLESLAETHGPRAYRHAMLQAGRAGQRLYLAATALGLGCCGVGAFYDEDAARHARLPENGRALYLLACGPVKGWGAET
jgi:SagB-type dehydrogenase family enzyme